MTRVVSGVIECRRDCVSAGCVRLAMPQVDWEGSGRLNTHVGAKQRQGKYMGGGVAGHLW